HWAIQDGLTRLQQAFTGVFNNFPRQGLARTLRIILFPWGLFEAGPSDRLDHAVARKLMQPGPGRDRLTPRVSIPDGPDEPLALLEAALHACLHTRPIETKIRAFEKT